MAVTILLLLAVVELALMAGRLKAQGAHARIAIAVRLLARDPRREA